MHFNRVLLLLSVSLFPSTLANLIPRTKQKFKLDPNKTSRHIKWLTPARSLLVRLQTPDLPLWDPQQHIGLDLPSNFILSLELTPDNSTLLVQGQAFLPLPDPHVPPRLFAPQTGVTHDVFHAGREPLGLLDRPSFGLDYTRLVRPRDDRGVSYSKYEPEVTLDVIGAGVEGYDALLASPEQWVVKVKLSDRNPLQGAASAVRNFLLVDAWLEKRGNEYSFPDVRRFKACTAWSWRCEEIKGEPWYRNILRRDFDEFGKIGSGRWWVLRTWSAVKAFLSSKIVLGILILAVGWVVLVSLEETLEEIIEKVKGVYKRVRDSRMETGMPNDAEGEVEASRLMGEEDAQDDEDDIQEKDVREGATS